MPSNPSAAPREPLHILVLPKWWPNDRDPQLGDFIRKQMQAAAAQVKITVLHVEGVSNTRAAVDADEVDGLFVVRSTYTLSNSALRPVRRMVNFLRYWDAAKAGLAKILERRGLPRLSHVHILVRPALVAWWLRRTSGVPYILSEQSSEYMDGSYARKSRLFHRLNRQLFSSASAVTAVSARLGDKLVELGLCEGYTVVPNVIPGLDRPLPPLGAADHFLVVADLVDRTKNVSGVIRAFAALKRIGLDLKLSIIGDGPDRAMLETLAAAEGVASAVSFLGRLPNSSVLDHMAKAGSVIVNSNVETFSVVTGEALAQGKPVIATRCGGPQAFIQEGNGILVDVGDDAGLAEALRVLHRTHGTYDPMVIRTKLSTRYSPEAVGNGFAELYRRFSLRPHG
ncbi:MAG: glycosyltransferase [Flavobacteriales bacterium]|nr:glycosyltransferase [Flavobacteriales bacterium]